jgi:hypothetical protein
MDCMKCSSHGPFTPSTAFVHLRNRAKGIVFPDLNEGFYSNFRRVSHLHLDPHQGPGVLLKFELRSSPNQQANKILLVIFV